MYSTPDPSGNYVYVHTMRSVLADVVFCSLPVDHTPSTGFVTGISEDVVDKKRQNDTPVMRRLAPHC